MTRSASSLTAARQCDIAEHGRQAGDGMGLALLRVQGGSASVQLLCLIRATEEMVHLSGTGQRGRLLARRRGELGSLGEEACGLLVRPESGGPLGAGDEGPSSALTELGRVLSVGIEAIRLDEV